MGWPWSGTRAPARGGRQPRRGCGRAGRTRRWPGCSRPARRGRCAPPPGGPGCGLGPRRRPGGPRGSTVRWSNHNWQILLHAMGAVAVGLVASAGVGATICWSGCRCCRSTGWRRPGLSAARSAPTATATAVGTRPTSCWCAGRWRGPTATGRWGRCHRRCLMRMGVYARVSTSRQAQAQTIEQQLERLRAAVCERGWVLDEEHVYRDDGYSGASLGRPGLDRLRDHAALADLDVVLVVAPDRLARNYVHQVLLVDELARHGCRVEFLDRPMSQDPHDQLLLQIRGAVAEYERTLIAERMRRGRQARLRAGTLLPWTRALFGYRVDPQRSGEVAGVRVEPDEAVLVAQLFDWYLEAGVTLYRLAKRLTDLGIATPTGKLRWNVASVRGILRNPAYTGRAQTNRTRVAPARQRKAALLPVGPGQSHAPRPPEEWVTVAVPQIVSEETFAQVQAKLDANQQGAARNTRHPYLLRALVSCGACRLSCTARTTQNGYNYYICVGRTDALRRAQGQRCTARYAPAAQLDELVWADLSALLTDPAQVAAALARARGGEWLPQELHARQRTIGQAIAQLERQRQLLVELLIDRVVVTDGEVEIRYALPTAPEGPHPRFCQLRKDHLRELSS